MVGFAHLRVLKLESTCWYVLGSDDMESQNEYSWLLSINFDSIHSSLENEAFSVELKSSISDLNKH